MNAGVETGGGRRRTARRAAAALLAPLLFACGSGEEVVFGEYAAPGGAHVLRVTVTEPRVPQRPFLVRAYLVGRDDAPGPPVVETELVNDGVPFTDKHIAVRWISARHALMCLRASDLPDRGLRIEASDPVRVEAVDRC
jgi:hypothetical protein